MTTIGRNALCSTCKKASGILICQGCRRNFCFRHVGEHRQELNLQLDELANNHDQLQQTIIEQTAQPHSHPLIKELDQWEQQPTDDDVRQQLLTMLAEHRIQIANELARITNELKRARYDDDFMEIDLKQWKEKLDQLKLNLDTVHPKNNHFELLENDHINDASTEIFHQTSGDVQIEGDGKIAVHGATSGLVAVRCRGEYSLGKHRFRFRIDRTSNGIGFIYGIVSKSTPMSSIINRIVPHGNNNSETSSFTYTSLNNDVICSFTGYRFGFQANGTYEIFIDCDYPRIHITSEDIQAREHLYVDREKFPFPWQFFIVIHYANDRVCLC